MAKQKNKTHWIWQPLIAAVFIILFLILLFKVIPDLSRGNELIQRQKLEDKQNELIGECINGCILVSEIINDIDIFQGGACLEICEENIKQREFP